MAAAARRRGARVTLIAGPVSLSTPPGVRRIDVRTSGEMMEAVLEEAAAQDVVVMAAAVADFAPATVAPAKIKRALAPAESRTLVLKNNPDILKALGERKGRQVLVGFALETEDGPRNARGKLQEKHLDLIVLNNPLDPGAAFGSDTNVVTILGAQTGANEELGRLPKTEVAERLLDRIRPLLPG